MGNSIVHVSFGLYLSNSDNQSEYWVKEQLGGIGAVFLALLNFAAGYFALRAGEPTFFDRLDAFVAVTGTFFPSQGPAFLRGLGCGRTR